ncbi:hypothetical protein [Denitrobaculum tricleocarpae]|uniref:Lipoprotein n=1 Tax=Denitrobaculum tricleocarpae TaxID=2591009 RepID=A0A545TP63_9PROT|nr:hypothetical protein [Denitrobaculum tricleocarpae]TQV79004.1 hypothetical protein FKG95_15070 [Denitrobaculum tricleocarpae]
MSDCFSRKRLILVALLTIIAAVSGCSSSNWKKTGERWRDNHCREVNRGPCRDGVPLEHHGRLAPLQTPLLPAVKAEAFPIS